MSWEKLFKRYIWDDDRTPYFVPASRMTKRQADHEIFAYTVFLGILLAIVCLAALPHAGASELIVLYAFSAIVATVVLGVTKHLYAAWYCSTIPLALLAFLLLYGFPAELAPIDHFVLIVFSLVWLRYAWRVVGIARAYPDMPEPRDPG
jgi:RsiW-degrading membrane proteinase PrsW (M82 family)